MKKYFPVWSVWIYPLLFVALVGHVSQEPVLLGRYSMRFGLLLLAYVLLFVPYLMAVRVVTRYIRNQYRSARGLASRSVLMLTLFLFPIILALTPLEIYQRINYEDIYWERNIRAFHPFLQIQPIKNQSARGYNSQGFRGVEISKEKPKDTIRIFFLGGSTVGANDQPVETTHAGVLERLLKNKYPEKKIEVLNAGYEWYTSQHSLINYLFKIRDYQPDVIVCWHAINDLYRSFSPAHYSHGSFEPDYSHFFGPVSRMVVDYFRAPPIMRISLLSVEQLIQPVRQRVAGWLARKGPSTEGIEVTHFPSLGSFRRNLDALIAITQLDGVHLILATQPSLYREGLDEAEANSLWMYRTIMSDQAGHPDIESAARGMDLFNREIKRIGETRQVSVVDLAALMPQTAQYLSDDCHYTKEGNRLIGRVLFQTIMDNGLIRE
jgi:hypothetical protein